MGEDGEHLALPVGHSARLGFALALIVSLRSRTWRSAPLLDAFDAAASAQRPRSQPRDVLGLTRGSGDLDPRNVCDAG